MTKIEICHNCPKRRMVELDGRTVPCHSVCPEYREARAKRDEELYANYELNQLIGGYYGEKIKRSKT